MIAWHQADQNTRMYCNIEGGKKIAMPRYYKNKIYTDEQRERIGAVLKEKMRIMDKEEYEREKDNPVYWHNKWQHQKSEINKLHSSSKKTKV